MAELPENLAAFIYTLDGADLWLRQTLDEMQVLYHRPSGQTHILIEPVPQIFDCLLTGPKTPSDVADMLMQQYQLEAEEDVPAKDNMQDRITARLDEMVTLGFVKRDTQSAQQDFEGPNDAA